MTGPWPWPIGWVVRGAALALASGIVYLLTRRAGPRAGASAASWGLVLMAGQPALLLLPWPRLEVPRLAVPGRQTEAAMPGTVGSGVGDQGVSPTLDGDGVIGGNPSGEPGGAAPDGALRDDSRAGEEVPADVPREVAHAVDRPGRLWPWGASAGVALVAMMAVGLARLAAGLRALDCLRRGAVPIADAALIDLAGAIAGELSVRPGVEIRETARLTTPATFGWKRPVVLLPDDWRSWDAAELRAVLAHELAHVRGRDYPAALLAQLGVALHPYNPIVHWLSARLRLDQELDADATAARLSGGRRPYLACLARLALRRDDRAATWPASAFLPIRGTFERRIEMLRHDRTPDRGGPSRPLRLLTIASLAASALLCTGLRGPSGPDAAVARQQEDAPRAAASEGFDLSPVPQDAAFVAAIKPAALAETPELMALLDQVDPLRELSERLGRSLADLDQLTLVGLRRREDPPDRRPMPAPDLIIVRTVEPSGDLAIGPVLDDAEAVAFLGTTYHRSRAGRGAAFRADDRTLIVSQDEPSIRSLIAGRNRPGRAQLWQEAAEQVGGGEVLVAFETPWLVQLLDDPASRPGEGLGDPIGLAGPMLDRTYGYALGIDVLDGMTVDAVALCADEEGAGRVAETAQALGTLARNVVGTMNPREGASPEEVEAVGTLLGGARSLLDSAAIEVEGSIVRLRAESGLDLAGLARVAAPSITASRVASRRAQAMTNLKQIALALHNYHDTYGSFPSPVLHSDHGMPYSWRVAILPFLEHAPIYHRYRFDEPWDGPSNRALLEEMPEVFDVPGSDNDPTHADVFALVGPLTLMGEPGEGTKISDVRDGTSNTIMVVESKRPIPWTKPEDIQAEPGVVPELGGFWPEGFQAAFGDGAVRFVTATIDPMMLYALVTRDGGEVVSVPPIPSP